MAGSFGSLLVESTSTNGALTDVSLSVSATAGKVLVGVVKIRDNSGSTLSSITDPPDSHWGTAVEKGVSSTQGFAVWVREATGDSNDNFDPSWNAGGYAAAAVFQLNDVDLPADASDYGDSTTSSVNGGSATPVESNGLAVALLGVRRNNDWSTGFLGSGISIGDSYNIDDFSTPASNGRPLIGIATKNYSTTAAQSPTWSSSVGSGAVEAIILVFPDAVGGTAVDVTPPKGSVATTGHVPAVNLSFAITPPKGSVVTTGYAPTVDLEYDVTPPKGSVNVTGHAPTVDLAFDATPPKGSITITGYPPTPSIIGPLGDIAITNIWKANNGTGVSTSVTCDLDSEAVSGRKLAAIMVGRFGSERVLSGHTGWDITNTIVGDGHEIVILERIATANASDNFYAEYDAQRNIALIVVELENADANLGNVGISGSWNTSSITAATGAVTPTKNPGIAIAILGVKDRQDWQNTGGANSTSGLSVTGSYSDMEVSSGAVANGPLVAIASKSYSTLAEIASATWSNIVNVSDYCFGGVVCFSRIAGDADTAIPKGSIRFTGHAPVVGSEASVEAGGPYSGEVSTAISLDATVTNGSDSNPTLLWEIVSGGTGTFSDSTIADPTFTPDSAGSYVLRLTVTPADAAATSDVATVTSLAADGVWTAVNMDTALDAEGLDGTPNTATTLTATAANATVIADAITLPSGNHISRWFVKRKTGTGPVNITIDGGSTWTKLAPFSSTVFRERYIEDVLADPSIGIQIETSGDEVIVGNAELIPNAYIADIAGAGHIYSFNSPVTSYRPAARIQVGTWTDENWIRYLGNSRFYPINEGTGSSVADSLGDGSTDGTIQNFVEENWSDIDVGSYKHFVNNVPVASAKSLKVVTDTRNNLLALLHGVVTGELYGWDYSQDEGTGDAEMPQYMYYKKGALWIRCEVTWNAMDDVESIDWKLSENSGGLYDDIGTMTVTYDSDYNPELVTWS